MTTPRTDEDWKVGDEAANAVWDAIMGDDRLRRLRSQASLHDLRLLIGHAQRHLAAPLIAERDALAAAVEAMVGAHGRRDVRTSELLPPNEQPTEIAEGMRALNPEHNR